jgi:7-cyano-7-deazaguanine synthase in queuosine biosynthesis
MKTEVTIGKPYPKRDLVLVPGKNLIIGEKEFCAFFGAPSSLENDLLTLSSAVMACDIALKRGERENISRTFELRIPIVNVHLFLPLQKELEDLLYLLSYDNWTIDFQRKAGKPEPSSRWKGNNGKTLLFSGGLDSLSCAVDELSSGSNLVLVSHFTHNRITKLSQETLWELVTKKVGKADRFAFMISGRKTADLDFPSDELREESQRTRSFLFLSLSALVARRTGNHRVLYIAENGQMAIHLPLTTARLGAFSTHTAHPEVVAKTQNILGQLLEFPFVIENPYLYKTKGEVIANTVKKLGKRVSSSVSCWRGSRVQGGNNHCGVCVPCLIRRIALEVNSLPLKEYEDDLFRKNIAKLPEEDIGKRNLVELLEFIRYFDRCNDAELEMNFPDLLNPLVDRVQAIAMYRRFAKEANKVLSIYPSVKALL